MAERATSQTKILECVQKISDFKTKLLSFSFFATAMERLIKNDETVAKMKKVLNFANEALSTLENEVKNAGDDNAIVKARWDLIEEFLSFFEDEKLSMNKDEIQRRLGVVLATDIDGVSYNISLTTLQSLQNEIVNKDSKKYLKQAKIADQVAPLKQSVTEALKELGESDDSTTKGTIAARINCYNNYWKTTEAKKVLAKLKALYSALYTNFTTIDELLTEIVDGKKSLSDSECEGLVDAINYLIGANNEYDGEHRQPNITTEVDVSFKKNAAAKTEDLGSQQVTMPNLQKLAGEAKDIFEALPSWRIPGTTANKIIKVARKVFIGLMAGAVVLTAGHFMAKGFKKAGAAPVEEQLTQAQEEEDKSIQSYRGDIAAYIDAVSNKIGELQQKASDDWGAKVGGDKAKEALELYINGAGENANFTALNNANLEALAAKELSDARQAYQEATEAYNAIMDELTKIEESVGGYKDVDISREIVEAIPQDSLKGWRQAFTKSEVLAINISDIRTQEADGEDSALVRIIFQKNNGEKYIAEGEVAGVSEYYQDGELSADDIGALLENKQGKVQIYKDYSSSFGTSDKIYLYGVENVLAGQADSSVEYFVYSSEGELKDVGEVLYNNVSQNATKDMILQAVEDAIYGQNEM